jgi:formylglycine-generating enzyme required for sulfatase activity
LIGRFEREAKLQVRLRHAHLVQVRDYSKDSLGPYIVMDWIEGQSLAEVIAQSGPMEWQRSAVLISKVALALQVAHDAGIIHRDVKPANILLDASGEPFVTDFGLARIEANQIEATQSRSSETATNAMLGTINFASPEQQRNPRNVCFQSDIWSLGATLYKTVTGFDVLAMRESKIPEPLRPIVLRATEQEITDRYATMRMMSDVLMQTRNAAAASIRSASTPTNPVRDSEWLVRQFARVVQQASPPTPPVTDSVRRLEPGQTGSSAASAAEKQSTKARVAPAAAAPVAARPEKSTIRPAMRVPASTPTPPVMDSVRRPQPGQTGLSAASAAEKQSTKARVVPVAPAPVTARPQKSTIRPAMRVPVKSSPLSNQGTTKLKTPQSFSRRRWIGGVGCGLTVIGGAVLSFPPFEKAADPSKSSESASEQPQDSQTPALLQAPFSEAEASASQEAWAKHLGISVEVTNSLGMKFRVIPPGTFDMGSPKSEPGRSDNEAIHKVTITQPKLMGIYPVTQGEWTKVMGSNPSHFTSVSGQDTSRFPVERVSWEDSQEFLNRMNAAHPMPGWRYRLPTEAEWEYACRAGTVTPFWFGSELNGQQANCDGNHPYQTVKGPYLERPCVVGRYGANAFGLFDQHGQVLEWCEDRYGDYDTWVSQDPKGPSSGSSHVLRGGSWSPNADSCRSADRYSGEPSGRSNYAGLRVLCELS